MSDRSTSPSPAALPPRRRFSARPLSAWLVTLYTAPFRIDDALGATVPLAELERHRRQALMRVILFTLFALQQIIGLPLLGVLLLTNTLPASSIPLAPPLAQSALAVLCIVCWLLNRRGSTLTATLLFIYGLLSVAMVAMVVFGGGITDQALFLSSFLATFILVAGFLLPREMIWATAALLIVATLLNALLRLPDLAHEGALRGPALALLELFYLFIAALTWLFARSAAASTLTIQRMLARERELAALKEQFLLTTNHELRTPFMAMYGNLEFLAKLGEQANPEQRARRLHQALKAGETVRKLLNAILDASLADPGHFRVQVRPVALAAVVQGVLTQFDPHEIGEPGRVADLSLDRSIEVNIPAGLIVQVDEARLRQILANLVSNALKYSEPGMPIAISARIASETPPLASVSVRDRGLGVPPGEAHQLFQRFARLKRDIGGTIRGTGVGLYLCRVLVEAMGGQIWVESTGLPGDGSTFTFTLPLARTELDSATSLTERAGI